MFMFSKIHSAHATMLIDCGGCALSVIYYYGKSTHWFIYNDTDIAIDLNANRTNWEVM